jgi:hypothetical protein
MIRIVLLSLALLPLASAAQMYKWVDEKGRTVYSEQPPPDGKASTKLDIKSSPGSSAAPTDWKQKEMDARQTRITKEQQDQNQKAEEQNASSARRNNCLEAQRQLNIVQAPRPAFQVNEKGEKVYLEDKDRQREIDGWAAHVKKYCD